MKITQGVFFTGYTTLRIEGKFPEFFLNRCVENGISVWNVKKIDEFTCEANVRLEDVPVLKKLRSQLDYKIRFRKRHGLPFLLRSLLKRRSLVAGFVLGMIAIFLLSNMVWGIKIEGVTPEVEYKIKENLKDYGIKRGAWKFTIETPGQMQQKLLADVPELLWIGVTEKGTTYHLEGVEKTIVTEPEEGGPQSLYARKKGIIVDMYVEKGEPAVELNDYVESGDLLVSGAIGREEEPTLVHAEGEVIAETWYKSEVVVPLNVQYEVITGEKETHYGVQLGGVRVPLWGFKEPEFKRMHEEEYNKPFYLFKWELPIKFSSKEISEAELYKESRTDEEALQIGVKQAEMELKQKIPQNSKIITQKVLHRQKENGKVKLILYFKVHEDISKPQPITQGD
ncbi:sporulation protein YqfD [Pontibacillus salipaludis]|uniref:Sporulation protein YqfD n=1 Tax=Pontibacillus salipaludis TaxID=1697394 RepID=A0ABQ1PVF5_9BACI|nr:sporulation protein YqfD [Pontibacillus salipaludis]GGD04508.1 sporulation protein YqfD [Pontibacillus salipaludis]